MVTEKVQVQKPEVGDAATAQAGSAHSGLDGDSLLSGPKDHINIGILQTTDLDIDIDSRLCI